MDVSMPSLLERSRTPLNGSLAGALRRRAFTRDEKFFLNGVHYENFSPPQQEFSNGIVQRLHVGGKFLFLGNDKFCLGTPEGEAIPFTPSGFNPANREQL